MSRESIGWSEDVGERPYRVIAEERVDRAGKVYLRWREHGNWRVLATELTVRSKSGELVKARTAAALKLAKERAEDLASGKEVAGRTKRPLTLSQGLRQAIDAEKGRYPVDSMHRREVKRELERAVAIWGDRAWNTIKPGDLRQLYRARAKALVKAGHVGRRGAEITVSRVLAVAEWLRGEGLIEAGACHPPKDWKKELGAEVTEEAPKRPRYSLDELRRILAAAPKVDPRFALIVHLGIGLRLGQVRRVMRRMVDLEAGSVRVPGRGKKGGALVALLPADVQMLTAAFSGYLAPLEEQFIAGTVEDYPLFPQGQLTAGRKTAGLGRCRAEQVDAEPVSETAVRKWWKAAEKLAEVEEIKGRVTYGGKRQAIDAAKTLNVSRDVLTSLGGWADPQMADRIYADRDARTVAEGAAHARAQIRGSEALVTPKA